MKQEIISYITSIKEDIYTLSNYLYTNPETNYNEYKCYSYIVNILKTNNFEIQENYCDIPTSFYAQYGNGHPKICYICKYSSTENLGHIFGNNVNASISVAAALGLSKVISKSGGSVIIIGCPGDYVNGAELALTKEKCFEDMDVIIAAHCDITNAESGSSMATPCDISRFELPSQELLSNKSLSRIFTHNLKESGIIDIGCCKDALYGLGIGSISHITPCIYPSIAITENPSISCPSSLFAIETQTDFCKNNMIKAAEALAITGLDIIEKQDLLKEFRLELI